MAAEAPPFRGAGLYRKWSSFWTSRRTCSSKAPSARSSESVSTDTLSPQPGGGSGWPINPAPSTISEGEEPSSGEEPGEEQVVPEEIVPEGGIKPGMERDFESKEYGFRLGVQRESVPSAPPGEQYSGPITVNPLKDTLEFEGENLEGMLEVHCLPAGRRFDAPLLFDFLVKGGVKDDPIMDQYGRIRYEVLTKACGSKDWVRDPESSIPLEIVKDSRGRIYVRAQVRHFSSWSFWKRGLNTGRQMYRMESISLWEGQRHRSLIMNTTPDDVTIHAYAMRMSQWTAALESFKAGAGVEGVEANAEFGGSLKKQVHAASLLPQMVPIPSEHSHWFEIPRVGAGFRSRRKAVVAIVTESNDERDGKRLRLEAVVHLRSRTKLTVTLRVQDGKVKDSAAASDDGGILSLLMRVIRNQCNATPSCGPPPSSAATTEVRSRSGANIATSSAPATGAEVSTGRFSGGAPDAFPAMAGSEADQDSPCLAAATDAVAAAPTDGTDAARLAGEEKSSDTTSVKCAAANNAPAAVLSRELSGALCPPHV